MDEFKLKGAKTAKSIKDLVINSDILITCLPSPQDMCRSFRVQRWYY